MNNQEMIDGLRKRIRSLNAIYNGLGTPEDVRQSIASQKQSIVKEIQTLQRMDDCEECFHTGCVCGGIGHSCHGCCSCIAEV